jgi:hypothetical protein
VASLFLKTLSKNQEFSYTFYGFYARGLEGFQNHFNDSQNVLKDLWLVDNFPVLYSNISPKWHRLSLTIGKINTGDYSCVCYLTISSTFCTFRNVLLVLAIHYILRHCWANPLSLLCQKQLFTMSLFSFERIRNVFSES